MHTTGISQRGQDGALAELLLERGADPNDAEAGYSALHAAVLREQEALVGVPLAYGGRSELHGRSRHPRPPLQRRLAETALPVPGTNGPRATRPEIAALLRSYGDGQ